MLSFDAGSGGPFEPQHLLGAAAVSRTCKYVGVRVRLGTERERLGIERERTVSLWHCSQEKGIKPGHYY